MEPGHVRRVELSAFRNIKEHQALTVIKQSCSAMDDLIHALAAKRTCVLTSYVKALPTRRCAALYVNLNHCPAQIPRLTLVAMNATPATAISNNNNSFNISRNLIVHVPKLAIV